MKKKRINIHIPPNDMELLKYAAEMEGGTISGQIIKLLHDRGNNIPIKRDEISDLLKISAILSEIRERYLKERNGDIVSQLEKVLSKLNFILATIYESKDFQQFQQKNL